MGRVGRRHHLLHKRFACGFGRVPARRGYLTAFLEHFLIDLDLLMVWLNC